MKFLINTVILIFFVVVFCSTSSFADIKAPTRQELRAVEKFDKLTWQVAGLKYSDFKNNPLTLNQGFEQFKHRLAKTLWSFYMVRDFRGPGNRISYFNYDQKQVALRTFETIAAYYGYPIYEDLLEDPLVKKYYLHYFIAADTRLISNFYKFESLLNNKRLSWPDVILSFIRSEIDVSELWGQAAIYFYIKKISQDTEVTPDQLAYRDPILSALFKSKLSEFAMAQARFSGIFDEDSIVQLPQSSLEVAR